MVTSTCSDRRELARLLGPFYQQGALYIPSPYALEGVIGSFNLRLVLGDDSEENTVLKGRAVRVDPGAHGLTTSGYPGFALLLSELDPPGREFVADLTRNTHSPLSIAGAAHGQDPILCHVEFRELAEPPRLEMDDEDEEPGESTVIVGDDFSFMDDEEYEPEDELENDPGLGLNFADDYGEERTSITGELDMEFLNMSSSEETTDVGQLPRMGLAPGPTAPMRVPTPPPISTPGQIPLAASVPRPVPTPMPTQPGPTPMPAPMMPMTTPVSVPMSAITGRPVPTPSPENQANNPNFGTNNPNFGANNPSYGGNNPSYGGNNPSYGGNNPSYGGNNPNYGGNNPNYNEMPSSILFGDQSNRPNTNTDFVAGERKSSRPLIIAAAAIATVVLGLGAAYFLIASKEHQSVASKSPPGEDASPVPADAAIAAQDLKDAGAIALVADASKDVAVDGQPHTAPESACQVAINTEPEGAALFYLGTNLGITPYNGPINCEAKVVDIRHPQYEDSQTTFEIVDGKANAAVVQLKRPSFWVTINSVPDKATLSIDDEFIGKTPFSLPLPGFEWTSITISRKGFAAEIIDILPTEYKSAINIKLQRER